MAVADNPQSASILAVEQKPHRAYIKYLMTKKWSPRKIQSNLYQLGLSSPIEEILNQYYHTMIRPLIKKHNLGHIYQDYNSYMNLEVGNRGTRGPDELNFKLVVGPSVDDQINFLRFLGELGVIDIWQNELYMFYGNRDRVPSDPITGKCLIPDFNKRSTMPWIIVQSPHRYVIDEMILEGVPEARIMDHMRNRYDTKVQQKDIALYKVAFFSVHLLDLKEKIVSLEVEKQNLLTHIKNIDLTIRRIEDGETSPESVPDLLSKKKNLFTRVSDLNTNIRSLNATFSETAVNHKISKDQTYASMFEEMINTTYGKFKQFSAHSDRDVVDPLYKLTRMMSLELEMLDKAREMDIKNSDGAQLGLIKLINAREEELMQEREMLQKELAKHSDNVLGGEDLDESEILGLEELQKSAGQGEE